MTDETTVNKLVEVGLWIAGAIGCMAALSFCVIIGLYIKEAFRKPRDRYRGHY